MKMNEKTYRKVKPPEQTPATSVNWVRVESFKIERRRAANNRWYRWCSDIDLDVMNTRFLSMSDLLSKDAKEWDALRLVNIDTGEVLLTGLFGKAVGGVLPNEIK